MTYTFSWSTSNKIGKKISEKWKNNKKTYISVVPNTPVYDPTGAGDSFAGGTLGYIANHGLTDPVSAVVHGSAVASYTVSGFGLDNLCKMTKKGLDNKIKKITYRWYI